MPESWEVVKIESRCAVRSSTLAFGDLLEINTENDNDTLIHAIKVSDMNMRGNERDIVRANTEVRIPDSIARRKAIPPHSIVFPKRGAAIATNKKRVTTECTLLDPNLIAVVPDQSVNQLFLYYWFETFDLTSLQDLGPTPQLNKKNVDPLLFPMPKTIDEQEGIAVILDEHDRKLWAHDAQERVLQDLLQATLNKLMAENIPIHDFNVRRGGEK